MILAASAFGQLALAHYLLLSGLLFVIGLVGFLSRRNLIVMFLCTELMFQAAGIAFVAVGRYYYDFSGQVFVIFILTVAAALGSSRCATRAGGQSRHCDELGGETRASGPTPIGGPEKIRVRTTGCQCTRAARAAGQAARSDPPAVPCSPCAL